MSSEGSRPDDVRMRGFARRQSVAQVFRWLHERLQPLAHETIPTVGATGRVLARSVTSEVDVPAFRRAMMDGFAVIAADTQGASAYNRLALDIVGQSFPAQPCLATVARGQAVCIMTGAPMPEGADAVLPVESTQPEQMRARAEQTRVWVIGETTPNKHVGLPGEDIAVGTLVLQAGRGLRPQDVGLLTSIGVAEVAVVRKPRVRIIVTGNELLPPGSRPHGARIVDSNSPMLGGLIERDGGITLNPGIVPDEPDAIRRAMRDDVDVLLISGGSSVGERDHAPNVLAEEGELAIHGIAMRPASPTGMGLLDNRLVFLLPGNPVSCLCAYDFFAGCAIRVLGGRRWEWPYQKVRYPLNNKLVSVVGRVDYARVKLVDNRVQPLAISGASMLSSTTRADGFVVISENSEGIAEGTDVDVHLYDL